ncbi:DNA (cytosine-5-)-methyltransferase [Fibrobacter sp. UWB4]|uniref:DNA cytosine methyltransferase n=1 Tax=Fibrobacter sp. UWB4 TaxID=1964356 RepID=UPI000B51FD35|nr:DNA cytosine methyltransferase [Fibrobacter sp. UWB4]OWV20278.1 DNA (cytosine-5-)-methyltransferase [Fibrobacter sp. UWB4]
MKSIELFAGGGGLALASSLSGFRHSFLVEWDKDSAKTLAHNFSGLNLRSSSSIFNGDIQSINFSDYSGKIDLLSGGPPCQPFSIGGKSKAYNDRRDMFPEAARALSEIKPKAFVFENVRGLLRKNFSKYFNYILLQLTYPEISKRENQTWEDHLAILEKHQTSRSFYNGLKYNVVFRLVNAADYGIPQKRERVFIVGFRSDIKGNWSFPETTHSKESLEYSKYVTGDYWKRHSLPFQRKSDCTLMIPFENGKKPWVTVRDALSDLLDNKVNGKIIPNHVIQPGAKQYVGHTGSSLDEPSKTIKAGAHGVPGGENMIILDDGSVRYYTVREAARIQTFPDTYEFPCSWTESMRQIGNAVPVQLGKIVIDSVARMLKNARI